MSYMGTFKSMKHCKSSLKICLQCPNIMHSLRSFLCFEVSIFFCKHGHFYKAHIAPQMKRCRQTHIIPACKHSGLKMICTRRNWNPWPYDYEPDALPLRCRPICDLNGNANILTLVSQKNIMTWSLYWTLKLPE